MCFVSTGLIDRETTTRQLVEVGIKVVVTGIQMLEIRPAVVIEGEGDPIMRDTDQEDKGGDPNLIILQMEEAQEGREVVEVDDIAGGRDNKAII